MFLTDTKTVLGKNDYFISELSQILDELGKVTVINNQNELQTLALKSINGESALVLKKGNKFKIIKMNDQKCDITIQNQDGCFRIINKDIDLDVAYIVEKIGDGVEKISSMVKHDKNVVSRSYVKRNYDVISIIHSEFIDSSNIVGEENKSLDVLIVNELFAKANKEELIDLAEEYCLGIHEDSEEDELDEENPDLDEEELEEDMSDLDEDEFREEYREQLRDYMDMNENEAYDGYVARENGIELDKKSTIEMVDDVTADLIEEIMYLDEDLILSIDTLHTQIDNQITKALTEDDPDQSENER